MVKTQINHVCKPFENMAAVTYMSTMTNCIVNALVNDWCKAITAIIKDILAVKLAKIYSNINKKINTAIILIKLFPIGILVWFRFWFFLSSYTNFSV